MPAKPLHPAFVHFPIAFLLLGYGLDIVNHFSGSLPAAATSYLAPSNDLSRAAYSLISLGLIAAVPALVSGIREALVAIGRQGMFEANGAMKKKFGAMIAHAVANDLVLGVTTYIWYKRHAAANNTLAGKLGVGTVSTSAAAYKAQAWMVAVEAVLFVALNMAGSIGGTLAYNFGMGVSIAGGAKKSQ